MNKIFKVGLIGCGHIAETYFRAHKYFNNFKIIKCADINNKAAKKCAKRYNIENLTVNNLLKDKNIEIILNLTPPKAHFQIAKKSLLNGKHVYSEKPLSINLFEGKELLKISQKKKTPNMSTMDIPLYHGYTINMKHWVDKLGRKHG